VSLFLESINKSCDDPVVKEARREILSTKHEMEEDYGKEFHGSFLGRNAEQGNVGMHVSKSRGVVGSNIDEAGLLQGGSTPWALNPKEEKEAKALFDGADSDKNRMLEPSEIARKFKDPSLNDRYKAREPSMSPKPVSKFDLILPDDSLVTRHSGM